MVNLITAQDVLFPASLKNIKPKVSQLFYKGKLNDLWWEKSLAIVGSRRMTFYGQRVLEKIVPVLVEAGVTIISGFMYGIDQEAQRICLECGGRTVAVLGWGIDWPLNRTDEKLLKEIENKGIIFSEYPSKTKPQLWMFPKRNRIVAGLAKGVLVIEAAEKSGSLITAEWALKYHKKLLAVPGAITSSVSAGTNSLIKFGKAAMVASGQDILNIMGWLIKNKQQQALSHKDKIIALLAGEALSIDELALKTKQPVKEISVKLSLLQLKGEVVEQNHKFYLKEQLCLPE